MALKVGDQLPAMPVTDDTGKALILTDLVKDRGAVIFFYPRADTSGCTRQACGFRDIHADIIDAGYAVFGMSADTPEAQAAWKAKNGYKYSLLCDPSFAALKALGVDKLKEGGVLGITRSHLVVSKGGAIKDVQYGVTPEESVERAKAAVLAK